MGRLTPGFVKKVKQTGSYGDGHGGYGLTLLVRPRADGGVRRSWSQRIRIGGRVTNIGLGSYPVVSLAEARRKAFKNRRAVEQGVDPRGVGVPTFAEAAEKVIQLHREGWKPGASTEGQWRSSIRAYALPVIGQKPISEVTSADVLRVLAPIWAEKPAVARQLHQRIAAIMRWAIAEQYRADNPAGEAITGALPKQNGGHKHHRALPHAEVGNALEKIQLSGAVPTAVLAFELQVLTAVRPSEARLARWDEIDEETAMWSIPAERMKAKREHRVPLSGRAMKVLTEARPYSDGSGLVFPGKGGRPLGTSTFAGVPKKAGVDAVPHGFRSSFRIWVEECTDTPRSVAEAALAHVNRDQVEAAYLRSDLFERRRRLMEQWADYLQ